jgi:hypothetical protein
MSDMTDSSRTDGPRSSNSGEVPFTTDHLLAHLQIEADFVVDRAVIIRSERLVIRDLLQKAHDEIERLRQQNADLRTMIDHPEALALLAGPPGSACTKSIGEDNPTEWYRRHWRNALDQWSWWHRRYVAVTGDERHRFQIEMDERKALRSTTDGGAS